VKKLQKTIDFVYISIGAVLGASLRYALTHALASATVTVRGMTGLTGTLAVNLLGCFAIGVLMPWLDSRPDLAAWARPLLVAGFLGSFTTFSAFALESHSFWQGHPLQALLYVMLSVGGGLVLFRCGSWIAQ
jgi:fluoride exporter